MKIKEQTQEALPVRKNKSTVVLFLIDGLSERSLQAELRAKHLPNLAAHFLSSGQKVMQAHAVFPSYTFPSISSLLHERPVNATGAIGNAIIKDGRVLHFESMLDRAHFSDMMRGSNIFTRLGEKGYRTLSLDYGLGVDATVAAEVVDVKSGLAVELKDFTYLDQKRIDSLKLVLSENPASQWPDFIFVHLIGLDFISHQYGSQSQEAFEYLRTLDHNLQDVFGALRSAEKENVSVISILTADHGFARTIRDHLNIEELVEKLDPQLWVLNEARFAALYYRQQPNAAQLATWASKLLENPKIEIIGYRYDDTVRIVSKSLDLSFQFQRNLQCQYGSAGILMPKGPVMCPQDIGQKQFHPFFLENLAYYFQADRHPDLLVIPAGAASFRDYEVGYHGGPSAEETLVPLLMRNSSLQNPRKIPALWELLQFL